MVKKHVEYLGQVVYEDGRPVVTGNDQLWIHKDEKTWIGLRRHDIRRSGVQGLCLSTPWGIS